MRECPDLVASFERFDDTNPFEPIKLGGAIRNPAEYSESTHGQLTAVIRYRTPYYDNERNPITISFGLGNDMTVNTILGMPLIKDLGMTPDFCNGNVTCTDSPATFELEYKEKSCGVPSSTRQPRLLWHSRSTRCTRHPSFRKSRISQHLHQSSQPTTPATGTYSKP